MQMSGAHDQFFPARKRIYPHAPLKRITSHDFELAAEYIARMCMNIGNIKNSRKIGLFRGALMAIPHSLGRKSRDDNRQIIDIK